MLEDDDDLIGGLVWCGVYHPGPASARKRQMCQSRCLHFRGSQYGPRLTVTVPICRRLDQPTGVTYKKYDLRAFFFVLVSHY